MNAQEELDRALQIFPIGTIIVQKATGAEFKVAKVSRPRQDSAIFVLLQALATNATINLEFYDLYRKVNNNDVWMLQSRLKGTGFLRK